MRNLTTNAATEAAEAAKAQIFNLTKDFLQYGSASGPIDTIGALMNEMFTDEVWDTSDKGQARHVSNTLHDCRIIMTFFARLYEQYQRYVYFTAMSGVQEEGGAHA